MTTPFTIDLTINMPDGGRLAKQLVNLYFPDMPADIQETASNLCEANKTELAQKFARLTLKRADAWPGQKGGLEIYALLAVSGDDAAFIKQVIAKYMDGFPGYLKQASGRYFSHDSFPPEILLQPTDWNADMH